MGSVFVCCYSTLTLTLRFSLSSTKDIAECHREASMRKLFGLSPSLLFCILHPQTNPNPYEFGSSHLGIQLEHLSSICELF